MCVGYQIKLQRLRIRLRLAFHVDRVELVATLIQWDVRKICISLLASLRNVPFSLVQAMCSLVKVIC